MAFRRATWQLVRRWRVQTRRSGARAIASSASCACVRGSGVSRERDPPPWAMLGRRCMLCSIALHHIRIVVAQRSSKIALTYAACGQQNVKILTRQKLVQNRSKNHHRKCQDLDFDFINLDIFSLSTVQNEKSSQEM